ncbi:sphingomyelin phosphodiesterase [Rickenella mellea]|uniref:Sphingomyelin phosphodiesterase n=1 Tax=Rickenella mellea TaxID=50990 RepID=A0A4Y7Q4P2_9AGAM|nr:sphingomyelin phosphodiesterase [Rickenella mellea]
MKCLALLTVFSLLATCAFGSILDTILKALESAVDCPSCHALLIPLQGLAHLGNDAFVNTFVSICKDLKLDDADVCQGAIGEEGPILAHDLRQISATGRTATLLCDALFGLCKPPAVNSFSVPFPKAAPSNPKVFTSTGKAPFQVVHFSDVHIDRQYTVGSESNCTKPICCRNFADHTGPATQPAGPNGNGKCDSPVTLADSMLEAAQQFGSSAHFSIFTGDVVEGAVWLVNQNEVTADLQDFNAEMASKLGAPIYGAIGNHDAAPVNSFPRSTTSTDIGSQWVFDTQAAGWTQWIGSGSASQLQHTSGSYALVVPGTNLMIVSVNTQYWYKQNFWLYDSDKLQNDPNGIFAFMVQALQAAEDAGQRAWIIGHMPLGKSDALFDQSNYYDQVVNRYKNTIAAQFFGHSHKDQFEIAYSDYSAQTVANAVSIAYIAPALTPTSGNPAFKIYDIDPDTYEVMDARVYMTDVSSPTFQQTPTWQEYYSARDSYGSLLGGIPATQSLNAAFWHNVTVLFENKDDAFQLFNTRITRGGKVSACTGDCKTSTICDLRALRAQNNCDVVTPGISFKRDGSPLVQQPQEPECEGSAMARLLRAAGSEAAARRK